MDKYNSFFLFKNQRSNEESILNECKVSYAKSLFVGNLTFGGDRQKSTFITHSIYQYTN